MSIVAWIARLRRRLDDEDFDQEIRAHLEIAAGERMSDGVDPQDARYAALREFGNVTLTTEAARRVWTPWWLEALHDQVSDVRYAIRALKKNPVFSLTVVAVLTIGIGLNAAVFTMLKGMALSPLAGVDHSARLAVVFAETSAGRQLRVSYPDYRYLRDHVSSFAGLFGSDVETANLGHGRTARPVFVEFVTGNYFQVLGVRAARGRTLLPSDEVAPAVPPIVVISDRLWRTDLHADPEVIGKTIEINTTRLTVAGVADPAFHGTIVSYDVEAFIPVMMAPTLGFTFRSDQVTPAGILSDPRATILYPQGFLRPGSTLDAAAAEVAAISTTLGRERSAADATQQLKVVRFWQFPGSAQTYMLPSLTVLSAMGLLVLAIACANVAGLVLVRGLSRRGEIAVRLALGATRARIVRLLVVENLILAAPGAVFGVLLAQWGIPVLVGYAEQMAVPEHIYFNITLDSLVIGFAVLVACGCALVFGFVPALQSSQVDLVSVINADASPRGAPRGRFRAGLVVAQVAVSMLLLVGAGLATRSLDAARRTDPGFDAQHVATVTTDVTQNAYDETRGRLFYRHLLEAARADAAVESATLAAFTPLAFLPTGSERVAIDGYATRRGEDLAFLSNAISPLYFRTLRIPLLAGREYEDRDDETAPPVAIVNATLAKRFWGGAANAIGKRIRVRDGSWRTVIGVAADVKYLQITEAPRPYFYVPFLQSYRPRMILHTRGEASTDLLLDRARADVVALDPELPLLHAGPLAETARGALLFFNLTAMMLFIFGVAGMALAALGTYGLVSYTVKQSTHEIGIRMALGASAVSVVRDFLGRGLRLGLIGIALGVVTALAGSQLLGNVFFGVSSTDAVSFARALAVVLAGVILATVVPAWRAARINPLRALRHQ